MIRKWFGKKDDSDQFTIDDLIVLERYEEAEIMLKERMKYRNDIHDHLKLADVYVGQRDVVRAVDEYVFVAAEYASDGFYERAIAALTKARRLNPMDDTIQGKVERYEQLRALERKRERAQEGFLLGQESADSKGTAVMEFQGIWKALFKTRLIRELDGDQLKLLFQGVEIKYVERPQAVVERGSREEILILIASGEVSAEVPKGDGTMMDVRSFGPGQIIGEAALFQHKPWPAKYVVKGKRLIALTLDQTGLETCLTGNPDPRGFLDRLRREGNDQEVASAVARLEAGR